MPPLKAPWCAASRRTDTEPPAQRQRRVIIGWPTIGGLASLPYLLQQLQPPRLASPVIVGKSPDQIYRSRSVTVVERSLLHPLLLYTVPRIGQVP